MFTLQYSLKATIQKAGGDPSGWYVPPWTLEADQDLNRKIGVKTAILSVTAPGPQIAKENAVQLARQCNDFQAKIRDEDPAHYGFFACLPDLLNDQEACLGEIARAFDELAADGIVIYTRYGSDNHYLGHPDFESIWRELNKRKAVVFVHPTHAVDTNLVNEHLPQPMFDYPHETGRTAIDMITRGTTRKFSDVKVILSHAGGTLPWLIYRAAMLPFTPMDVGLSTEDLIAEAQKFYYDTALSSGPISITGLKQLTKPGHILFGCDFPNAPVGAIQKFAQWSEEADMDEEQKKSFEYGAGLALFPRLQQYYP
ncbi:MAG: hypothetical protein GOMPHAMPRED_006344 [Gomphillus americanus]|uniref:6-methylsalicylate decarboxylase n=1 Tax=Gomphillus americanus TaxID=1940652 RepID=A0A8H3EKL0_9LECA|nr:MAG: hypothetical protein GOMPHAMPRED_006344 [Gomphillus americanus]